MLRAVAAVLVLVVLVALLLAIERGELGAVILAALFGPLSAIVAWMAAVRPHGR